MASSAEMGFTAAHDEQAGHVTHQEAVVVPEPINDDAYEEHEDGSVTIHAEEPDAPVENDFDDNLAEVLDESELGAISRELIEAVERDKESRSKRDELYAEGLRATGLGDESASGANFDGASDVVHPMIAEGCIDFAARAMKELYPPSGPCKTRIIGEANDEKLDRAERKRQYMNWQLTKQIPEYRSEMEQLLSQVPLGGSQYLKMRPSIAKKRAVVEFVPIDHFYLPFACSGLLTAHRATHHLRLTAQQFDQRVADGTYRDVPVGSAPAFLDDTSKAEAVSLAIEGANSAELYDEDGLRSVYEIQVDQRIEGDAKTEGDLAPYVVTIDVSSRHVLAIRRNWDEEDDERTKLTWVVEFPFIPWRGAYALGLPHIIGGLAASATGALRALLDSAFINNAPSGLRLKGSRLAGQTVDVEIGEFAEIDGPASIDDIRKLVMPFPFNPPSNTLFDLMKFVVDAGKGVIGTAEEKIADAGNDMPVGTALALIEQGSITYSAVHARLHAAQAQVLDILHRINSKYLDDQETVADLGALIVGRADFQGPVDIIPVSDPNIFSEAQRFAQLQAVLKLRDGFPGKFNDDGLLSRALKLLNFPEVDDVLNTPAKAQRVDEPYKENSMAAQGLPIMAYDGQDHLQHLMQHLQFATSPMFGGGPLIGKLAAQPLVMHCTQHMIMLYEEEAKAASGAVSEMAPQMDGPPLTANHALALAMKKMAHELGPIMPMLQQAQQLASQFNQPPPPNDPAYLIGMAEVNRKAAVDKAEQAADAARDERQAQVESDALALEKSQKQDAINADLLKTHMQGLHSLVAEEMNNATSVLLQELRNQGTANQQLIDMLVKTSGITRPEPPDEALPTIGDVTPPDTAQPPPTPALLQPPAQGLPAIPPQPGAPNGNPQAIPDGSA